METQDTSPIEGGYVVMPRHISQDSRNGLISNPERNLLMWIRLTADMTGVSNCSMQGLADEAFNDKVSTSYINKLLRSLKGKRYLWYRDRNGRRGSFEVHLPEWLLKNGTVKEIDNLFHKESVRARVEIKTEIKTEIKAEVKLQPEPILEDDSQKIIERKKAITAMLSKLPQSR